MRNFYYCALLATGLIVAPSLITPAQANEHESVDDALEKLEATIERLKRLERERREGLERLEEQARQREEEEGEKEKEAPLDPKPFRYASFYGGLGVMTDGEIKAINLFSDEMTGEIDFTRREGSDDYEQSASFFAIVGGWGRTLYREKSDEWITDMRFLAETRLIITGDYKGALDDELIEASLISFGVAGILEFLLQEHYSVYGGLGVERSSIDIVYTEHNQSTDAESLGLYYAGGFRYYTAPPGESGMFLDLRVEWIFPVDNHWERSGYLGLNLGLAY